MRLIDVDVLIKDLSYLYTRNHIPIDMKAKEVLTTIMEQPTAYDVDKVVEQLEEVKKGATELCLAINDSAQRLKYIEKEQTIALAIEIVKAGVVND